MIAQTINKQIRALRLERGLTLAQLSECSGLSVSYLSDIERGRTNPSVETIDRLAAAMGIEACVTFNVPVPDLTSAKIQQVIELLQEVLGA